MATSQVVGFYWEIYNAFDRVNFGNLVGDRSSPFFLQAIIADLPRTMQLGLATGTNRSGQLRGE